MDCHKARELIDQRVHETRLEGSTPQRDWSDLEAHLKACPSCAAEWNELCRTTALLAEATAGGPTDEEIKSMWNAISSAAPGGAAAHASPSRRGRVWQFVAASVATAAVLFLAFQIGHLRFGNGVAGVFRTLPVLGPAFETASGEITPDADSGWGIPVHPLEYERAANTAVRGDVLEHKTRAKRRPLKPFGEDERRPRHRARRMRGGSAREEYANATPAAHEDPDNAFGLEVVRPPAAKKLIVYHDTPTGTVVIDPTGDSDGDGTPDTSPDADYAAPYVYAWEPPETIMRQQVRTAGASPAQQQPAQANAKIIKTGDLTLEVDSHSSAVERAKSIAKEHGAFVADVSARERPGGALAGLMVIRVVPEQFEALFAALKALGRVEAENVKAADVTAEYVDLEARIASLEITEKRLTDLIANKSFVDKMSALLEVEREMTRVRSQIEQLTGQLRVMADRVALSTITLTIHEPDRVVPSASLSVEVPVLDQAANALSDALAEFGERLASGNTSKRDDGTLIGNYQLRISLARFAELVTVIESLGRVEQRQVNDHRFSDATADWADKVKCNVALVLFERSRQLPTGSIGVEIDTLAPALDQLESIVEEHAASIISNHTTRKNDGSSMAEVDIRVPAGRFAALVDSITTLGRTTEKTLSGEAGRIIGGAADSLCDLSLTLAEQRREVPSGSIVVEVAEFEPARKQLSELVADKGVQVLASASNQRTDGSWAGTFRLGIKSSEIEVVISCLESLGRVASRQISGTGLGDLSRIDPNTIGVVSLTLGEKSAISPGPERSRDSIRNRLRDGLAGLYASLGLIAYGLIVMAPWLIIVAALAWVVTGVWRKRRAA